MRRMDARTTRAWHGSLKGEDYKPTIRATIQRVRMNTYPYELSALDGESRDGTGTYASLIFGQDGGIVELRNIESLTWDRSLDAEAATATLTMLNTDVRGIGESEPEFDANINTFEELGIMTFDRGQTTKAQNKWGYDTETGYQDLIVPDRMVKTYEGYGRTPDVQPHDDTCLHQSGTWLIDKVTYSADGTITVTMRDMARLLMDQIHFPPVVPRQEYPLRWEHIHHEDLTTSQATGGSWTSPGYSDDSNNYYTGSWTSEDDGATIYVNGSGNVRGHQGNDAFDGSDETYWLSTGHKRDDRTVWVEGDFSARSVGAVRFNVKGGPYQVYISVFADGAWQGRRKIPWRQIGESTASVDIDAKQYFLKKTRARGLTKVTLGQVIENATKVRLTFVKLWDSGLGDYQYRAAVQDVEVYSGGGIHIGDVTADGIVGNYRDYTEIVQWLCAWAGFWWPPHNTHQDYMKFQGHDEDDDPDYRTVRYDRPLDHLTSGAVWGDFMKSGTHGVADLTEEQFDKQPLMDGINVIREMLGFVFFIDETGGVIWRMPNLWKVGNYLAAGDTNPRSRRRTAEVLEIEDKDTLIGYSKTLNSENVRERIFVANTGGAGKGKDNDDDEPAGIVIHGFTPLHVQFRRCAGWIDEHFSGQREAKVMADMIAAQQMFSYYTSSIVIAGYPGIQLDDQIRVYERVTSETHYHYVKGISSSLNNQTGEWLYTIDTHWLGERPADAWAVQVDQLDVVTQSYLNLMEH